MRIRNTAPAAAALAAASLALCLGASAPAYAHGDTLKVVVTGHRDGHVTTDVTWENDGDAVEERVAATVNAVSSDGARTVGPWRLIRDSAGPKSWTTAETLPEGTWKVTVETGFPALGRGEREVTVDAAAAYGPAAAPDASTPAGASSPAQPRANIPSADATAAPASDDADRTTWLTAAGVATAAVAGAAVGILLRRSRRRR
ncbi:hypothetical protein [Streptomyces sp. NPDC090022]|uniref:hypothetical protein n=1 Tax=Streptomyces sp. NPDC090022 TaxID=3365920 RepID=UPI0037FC0DEE